MIVTETIVGSVWLMDESSPKILADTLTPWSVPSDGIPDCRTKGIEKRFPLSPAIFYTEFLKQIGKIMTDKSTFNKN